MDDFDSDLLKDAAAMRPVTTDSQLAELRQMGSVLQNIDQSIEDAVARLSDLKRQRLELTQRTIPDLMDAANVDRVGLAGADFDLLVAPFYKASIPKENMEPAAEWLTKNGHADLMRTVVSVSFGPGEHEHALNIETLIRSYFRGRNDVQREPVIENAVHWKTLTSFVKEQLELGEVLPLDILGATVGRHAIIKKRKGR